MEDSTMKTQPAGISGQCRRTDRLLWEAYARSGNQSEIPRCRLLFPEPEEKKLRVSEQEARFAFVEALCRARQFRYSVETPTDKRYKFKGEKATSAQTDLTVYDLERCRLCNVEFKAGGISARAQSKEPIFKDVQKLLREPVWGLWFHLLESANSTNIRKLLEVIREQIRKVREGEYKDDIGTEGLTLHVCVLNSHALLAAEGCTLLRSWLDDSKLEGYVQAPVNLEVPPFRREPKVKRRSGWRLNERDPPGLMVVSNPCAHASPRPPPPPADRVHRRRGPPQAGLPAVPPHRRQPLGERRRALLAPGADGGGAARARRRGGRPVQGADHARDPRPRGDRRRRYLRLRRGGQRRQGGARGRRGGTHLRAAARRSGRLPAAAVGGVRGPRDARGPVRGRPRPAAAAAAQLPHAAASPAGGGTACARPRWWTATSTSPTARRRSGSSRGG